MLIKKVNIRNFGAQKTCDINLSRFITCILGTNGVGKSWIVRALQWVALNNRRGTSFLHWGENRSRVRLVLKDGTSVIRRRTPSENGYSVNQRKMKAVGTDVPELVQNTLRLTELNFQRQHDSWFWFTDTPGQVARHLNQIVNLDLIDHSLKRLQSRLTATNTLAREQDRRIDEAIEVRSQFEKLPDLRKMFDELNDKYRRPMNVLFANIEKLEAMIIDCTQAKIESETVTPPDIQPLMDAKRQWYRDMKKAESLETLLRKIIKSQSNVKTAEKQYQKALQQLKEMEGEICPTCLRPLM